MSLFNMVFGENPSAEKLLEVLQLTKGDFGRFRDVFVENGHIVVHTRNGGGNRDDYQDVFDDLESHPWHSHDEDCAFDNTYANIYFKVPEDKMQTFVALLEQGKNPEDTWRDFFGNT